MSEENIQEICSVRVIIIYIDTMLLTSTIKLENDKGQILEINQRECYFSEDSVFASRPV